jgi:fermentation-respiration switch protein FrsA (DUF1100 family)
MSLLVTIVASATAVVAGLWVLQRRLIYFPTRRLPSVGGLPGDWQEVAFGTTDGLKLRGWYVPPRAGSPVAIVFNGNGGNRADRGSLGNELADRGLGVLLTDYRGYGGNPGRPNESGLARDARAALGWVRGRSGSHAIVYFGESLGAAVAVELAAAEPPDALVLRSPFTSLSDVAAIHYPFLPVRLMLRDGYRSLERIPDVTAPVLVVAGTSDSIVPITQSRAVYEEAHGPKTWVEIEGADHNDVRLAEGAEMVDAVAGFLAEVLA